MKKILAFIACLLMTPNALSLPTAVSVAKVGISGLCSLTELGTLSIPLAVAGILHPRDLLKAQQQNTTQSNAPQIIIDHIAKLARERNINHAIKVVVEDDNEMYFLNFSMDTNNHILHIGSKESKRIESLLHNADHNETEKKEFDLMNASIHHELTHDINNDMKRIPIYEAIAGTAGSIGTSATLTRTVKKYVPDIKKQFTLHNSFKLGRASLAYATAFNIIPMNMGSKYIELEADDGIPNKKELLLAMAEYFDELHTNDLKQISTFQENWPYYHILYHPLQENGLPKSRIHYLTLKTLPKNCFNNPTVMNIFHMKRKHPSSIYRAKRLRKRIAELEKQDTQAVPQQDQPIDAEIQQ